MFVDGVWTDLKRQLLSSETFPDDIRFILRDSLSEANRNPIFDMKLRHIFLYCYWLVSRGFDGNIGSIDEVNVN